MKRFLAMVLTLAMLLSMVPAMALITSAETAEDNTDVKPFYALDWSDVSRLKFPNLDEMVGVRVNPDRDKVTADTDPNEIYLSFNGFSTKESLDAMAQSLKNVLDERPEGMRYIMLLNTATALKAGAEYVVYADAGIAVLKEHFTALVEKLAALGAKLDGVILDSEYVAMGSWYIYGDPYGGLYEQNAPEGSNRNVYHDIVNHPQYATDIRPLLEERGFKFYEEADATPEEGHKSEIWSMFPTQYLSAEERVKYAGCYTIWNTVMTNRKNAYLNEAVYEPLKVTFPNAILSDYQQKDSYAWLKTPSDDGSKGYVGGNTIRVGNANNYNTYANHPSDAFFTSTEKVDGETVTNYLYKNPAAYNKAEFEYDPYNQFMWDVNLFKNVYKASENELMNAWIAVYDYNKKEGSVGSTAYYAETVLHMGLLDPEPFLIYCAMSGEFGDDYDAYNKRMDVINDLMAELTRVAGYADREPIETPANWNDGFILSGMYTGGRNLWRLTPDTTDGATLEGFKTSAETPTFKINGATVTFPQGRIIEDGEISVVGTCGYWIETPKDVTPVVTYDADRYAENPSFAEDFESYEDGVSFNEVGTTEQKWETTDIDAWIVETENGLALELSGTGTLNNIKLPANITAGDSYAKQQAWEVSVTLAQDMNAGATVNLLTCGDDGILLQGNTLYIGSDVLAELATEQKYTVKREVNFNTNTSTYTVYAAGKQVAQKADVAMAAVELPVASIGFACADLAEYTVQIDDYKLYPTGLAQDLEVYNAANGIKVTTETADAAKVAYRLSWMNATAEGKKVNVVADCYDADGNLATKIVYKTVEMAPGADGVVTDVVANTYGSMKFYLEDAGTYTPGTAPEGGDFDWTASLPTVAPTEATEPVATEPVTVPTAPTAPSETPTEPAEGEKASVAIMSWDATLTVTYGGSPVYARCYAGNVYYTADGAENGTRWRATTNDANAENWNIKYEWPIGGVPTLTFKDVTLDIIGDDGKTMYEKKVTTTTDEETGEPTETTTYSQLNAMSAILPKTCHDLKLVLIGNNHVETNYGIIRGTVGSDQYFKNVTIVGEDGGKLTGFGRSFNLRPGDGYDLTIENAVLDLEFATSNGGEAIPIYTNNGDIRIINSTITCGNEQNVAINAAGTGNIYIHRSTVNATATLTGPSAGSGAINAPGGTVTISGNSKITANGTNCSAICAAQGVTVNGGELNLTAAETGINGRDGDICINAGVVEINAKGAFNKIPVLADDIVAYAGPNADNADYYNENDYNAKYVRTVGHLHTEVAIPAAEATCTADGCEGDGITCSVCGEIQVASTVIPALGHSEEILPATNSNCTETGLTAGVKCTTCGEILTAQEVVPAKGHSYVVVPAKDATCSEYGLTAGELCSACGDTKVYQERIAKLAHTEEVIPGKAATETATGLTEGKKCSVCGEILVAQVVVPVVVTDAKTVALRVRSTTVLSVTEGGSAVYTKNQEHTLTDKGGAEFTGTKQVTCKAEDDWNIKFEYPAGGVPTLTLKGAVIDHYNNATGQYSNESVAAIISDDGDNIPLKVVIAGNSTFETNYGIIRGNTGETNYFTDITITSIGDAKLTARGGEIGISVKDGYDLTLENANLDLYTNNTSATAIPINTSNGDITINGGNINIVQDNGLGMSARTSGNITITNAIVRVTAKGTANSGAIHVPSGTVEITNSIVEAFRPSSAGKGIQATSVTINSGYVHALAPYWGIDANPITINGGTVISETTEKKAAGYTNADGSWNNNNWNKALARSPIVTGYACFDVVVQDGDSATERNNNLNSADYWKDYLKIYHKLTEVPAVAATCDTDGNVHYWTCPDCGKNYADAEGKTLLESVVDPAGHDWAEATCTDPKTCKLCGTTEGMVLGHIVEIIPGYAKTCTVDGLTDGKKCVNCGEVVVAQVVIPAGHTEEILPAVEATDTYNGLTEGKKCSVCGKILVAQEVIPATATLTEKISMRSGDITLTASTDGKCTYLVNKEIDCYYNVTTTTTAEDGTETSTTEQVSFKGTDLVVLASNTATEPEGWTVKFSYPEGGVPTLTLRGAVLDYFDEASGTYSAHTSKQIAIYRDATAPVYDLHIVIEEDSYIATSGALLATDTYIGNVTVSSVGDATLTALNSKGIGAANGNLTLNNANLSIEVPKYNGDYSMPLSAKGNIIFNGGNYKLFSNTVGGSSGWSGAVGYLIRSYEGEIVINDGIFDLDTQYYSDTGAVGAIYAMGTNGKLTINGGIIDLNHGNIHAVKATNGILMTGGIFRTETEDSMAALPSINGAVTMTGGTLELWSANSGCTTAAGIIDWSALTCYVAYCGTYKGATADLGEFTSTHRYIKIAEHANTTEITGKDATCTATGLTAGQKCEKCGETVVEQEIIPALGHKEETVTGTAATCTATGLTDGKKCSTCGETLTAQEVIPAKGHKEETVTGTAATCTATGLTDGVKCSTCGETLSAQEVIPAKGHKEAEPVKENETATSYDSVVYCSVCTVELSRETVVIGTANIVVEDGKVYGTDSDDENTNHRLIVFFLGENTVNDPVADWNDMVSYGQQYPKINSYSGYKIYTGVDRKVVLTQKGNYVFQFRYTDADGNAQILAVQQRVEDMPDQAIVVESGKAMGVDMNNANTGHRMVVFYLGENTVDNPADWNKLVEYGLQYPEVNWAGVGYKIYTGKDQEIALTEKGNYVFQLKYQDPDDVTQTIYLQQYVDDIPKQSIDLNNSRVTTKDLDAANTNHRLMVFFMGANTVNNPLTDWDEMVRYGLENKDYNGENGYQLYQGKDKVVALTKAGNYAFLFKYTDADGITQTIALQQEVTNPAKQVINVENGKVSITDLEDANTDHRLIVAYLGENTLKNPLTDWNDMVAYGQQYPNVNSYSGYKIYQGEDRKVVLTQKGNYVFLLKFTDANGVTQTIAQQQRIEDMPDQAIVVESGTAIAVDMDNTHTNHRLVVFYLGENVVNNPADWNSLVNIGLNYPNVNWAGVGYKIYTGKDQEIVLTEKGNYVFQLKYADADGVTQTVYLQQYVDDIPEQSISVNNGKVILTDVNEASTGHRVLVFYMGTNTVNNPITDWDEMVRYGQEHQDINGVNGYQVYYGKNTAFPLTKAGNYAFLYRFTDANGISQTIGLQQEVTDPTEQLFAVNNGQLEITELNATNTGHRVLVFYIGENTVEDPLADWNELVAYGQEYKAINGDAGYQVIQGKGPIDLPANGNYVFQLKYSDANGATQTVAEQIYVSSVG